MKIEIAEPGRMTQTGSSLLKLIQNNNMPILDLLVRESIQNSLDARNELKKYVDVEFITGKFDSAEISSELEGITDSLNKRFLDSECDFLAIKDKNTVGLTGEMNYKKVVDNNYGNLLKLIYEICKPQQAEGAGGSWGLGKTVYFRIGIGLVIYYTRIKLDNGKYESRLAASYVEDETKANAMIPIYKGQLKRGIAWWGEKIEENVTQPITEEAYINKILKIFDIEEYEGEETGTTIIIPYIDRDKLLAHNQIEYLDSKGDAIVPFWCNSIEDYLNIAIQRWYAPRLNNSKYCNGAWLRTKINGVGLGKDNMEPVFKIIQSLYNRANYVVDENDYLSVMDIESKAESIEVRKYLSEKYIGVIAFTKVNRRILGMEVPSNKPSPFVYFNCEVRDDEINKPSICFTRKPGMIVAYENIGPWTANIGATNKDDYILGIFVLNSGVKLKNAPFESSLEEYVRKSEMADHTSWHDWSEGSYNPRLISKIQNGVNKIISKEYSTLDDNKSPKINSGLGKLFGDMLLPPSGFGKKATVTEKSKSNVELSRKKGYQFIVDEKNIKYRPNYMDIPFLFKASNLKGISGVGFEMIIDTESKKIDVREWEEKMGLERPFSIEELNIHIKALDGEKVNALVIIDKDENLVKHENISFIRKQTLNGTCVGLYISIPDNKSIITNITAKLRLYRNDVKPSFVFEKEKN